MRNYIMTSCDKHLALIAANPKPDHAGYIWRFRTQEQMDAWLEENTNPYALIPGHRILVVLAYSGAATERAKQGAVDQLAQAYAEMHGLGEHNSSANFKRYRINP